MLWQSVAGNSPFRGIAICNLGTSKTVISKFVTTRQILFPHILPHVNIPPQQCSRWTKKRRGRKKVYHKNVLIPWYPISYLTIASSGFFLGAFSSLPDAAIWWCLRTGGGGVRSRSLTEKNCNHSCN